MSVERSNHNRSRSMHRSRSYVTRDSTKVFGKLNNGNVHMLLEIPPKFSVSSIMGYLKGKSSLTIYERWGNAKFRYRNREFWCRGYYVDTTGKNTQKITEYIRNQLKEDAEQSQLTMDLDPFTGSTPSDRHTPLRRSLAPLGLHPLVKNHRLSRWVTFFILSEGAGCGKCWK